MTAIELLKQARIKIERGWTKGWFARDENGLRVHTDDPRASCFCLSGAMYIKVCSSAELLRARILLKSVLPDGFSNIVQFNDNCNTTKENVLNLIDRAIESGRMAV